MADSSLIKSRQTFASKGSATVTGEYIALSNNKAHQIALAATTSLLHSYLINPLLMIMQVRRCLEETGKDCIVVFQTVPSAPAWAIMGQRDCILRLKRLQAAICSSMFKPMTFP